MSGSRNTIIPDQDNQALVSQFDGQRFVLNVGDSTLVDGAPVLTFANEDVRFTNSGTASTTGPTATISIEEEDGRVTNNTGAEISAEDTGIDIFGEDARIVNSGAISGGVNGVYFANGGESSGSLTNSGIISSDSRAVNIGGDDIVIRNNAMIIGTGDQRNGTIYSDATAESFEIFNERGAIVDAGDGNQGAGIALETGDVEGDIVSADISNRGDINGRGQAADNTGLAGDGIRIFAGAENITFDGNILNSGVITSESGQGTTAGVRIANGANFEGDIVNARSGEIFGANNGIYFGTGDHDATIRNDGDISSDSRAVNIDGSGIDLINNGNIEGTGDQRNGIVYADGTAEDYTITNNRRGDIDAGEGNQGAGIALETGDVDGDTVQADIVNRGDIDGRGQAAADTGLAGDGIRIFAGAENVTFEGDIFNSGDIRSESGQGTTAGVRIANGVNFVGEIVNVRQGDIDGSNNGIYFGTGNHDATIRNNGDISSDSRAVNIDGSGIDLINNGDIEGTGDQRNGTVYADGTAEDYTITNNRRGDIDAGEGNQGAGIALETGDVDGDTVQADIVNRGDIDGRGQAAADAGLAGDGIRIFAGAENVTFEGDIFNSGDIRSESGQGTTAGVRIANGVNFVGEIVNTRGGDIDGSNNGVYFGTGDHDATIRNEGDIRSDSRAVNIDGSGIDLINDGDIEGTGNQRNGTVYADDTADDYTITNNRGGDIDAGNGNNGSAVSLQTGDVDGDIVTAFVSNSGEIRGRGDAEDGNTVGDGVRIFSAEQNVTFEGGIENSGEIIASSDSDAAVAISIEDGVAVTGEIVNSGLLRANVTAIDASEAGGPVNVVNTGRIDGAIVLSDNDDSYEGSASRFDTDVDGRGGNDTLTTGRGDDLLTGGLGDDNLYGGAGRDILIGDGSTQTAPAVISVTVENLLPEGGTFLTPVWFGFHDGTDFDLFDVGAVASLGLERLAEDGTTSVIAGEFASQTGQNGVDSVLPGLDVGAPGPIDPGESATVTIEVDPNLVGQGFFTWATMVIPSNDAFLAVPDDALADPIFDEDGNFVGPLIIERRGSDVLDAGTEVNNEIEAAFLNQTGPDQGTVEGGVVDVHPGFNGSVGNPDATPVNILGGTTAPGAVIDPTIGDFTADDDLLLRITIDEVTAARAPGDDTLSGGDGDDWLVGGLGDDILDGGDDTDTAAFDDVDVPVVVDLEAGTATRETGFSVSFDGVDVVPLGLNPDLSGDFVTEALAGNLYFNVHTNDFPGGEIRGQLDSVVDNTVDGTGTIVLSGALDAAQEPGPTSDSQATGLGTVVIEVVDGVATTYSLDLDITGLAPSDLLPVAGVSSIHLHNAPSGVNGPVVLDVVQDAGGDVNGDVATGDGDVFNETVETDTLVSIENIIGSSDSDTLLGDDARNELLGGDGDDLLNGRSGNDLLIGGAGVDTFIFEGGSDRDVVEDFDVAFDILDLSSNDLNFDDVSEVRDAARQSGDNVVIGLGNGDQITLVGVDLDQLTDLNTLV